MGLLYVYDKTSTYLFFDRISQLFIYLLIFSFKTFSDGDSYGGHNSHKSPLDTLPPVAALILEGM